MVAEKHSRLVPASYLAGASCPWPASLAAPMRPAPDGDSLADLTPAELHVAGLVAEGLSNKEVSTALGRAESTVKHQVAAAMRKLGLQSRCQLIVLMLTGRRPAGVGLVVGRDLRIPPCRVLKA
jgi:DNA-binding NarL/FixJ family response regulator